MDSARAPNSCKGPALLEHLTGPSRDTVTWLSESALDISLSPALRVRVFQTATGDPEPGVVARLHRDGDTYEIQALQGTTLWLNGTSATSRRLEDGDTIEFGDSGPITRFFLCREDRPFRQSVAAVVSDAIAYIRTSRKPLLSRLTRAVFGALRRLATQSTLFFRFTVLFALLALAILTWQQYRLSASLQRQIETSAQQLEGFASALSRSRNEALTPGDLNAVREDLTNQLTTASDRLAALERRSGASARVIAESISSVVFLQGAYGYRQTDSGKMLRIVLNDDGRPILTPRGLPLLSLEGEGPVAERSFTGTGFAVADTDMLVTNRHVVLPWEKDANVKGLAEQGFEPVMIKFIAYLPGVPTAEVVELGQASETTDLAVLRRTGSANALKGLRLAVAPPTPGDEIIVMGYPTGLRAMLAQSGDDFVRQLQEDSNTDFWDVAARLAEADHITPLASRGIVGKVTDGTLVYDAETTHGGSGGPVLNVNGAVVAVNTAILPEFGGSNLGVPAAKVRALLEAVASN